MTSSDAGFKWRAPGSGDLQMAAVWPSKGGDEGPSEVEHGRDGWRWFDTGIHRLEVGAARWEFGVALQG
jgi:hypothetical protein